MEDSRPEALANSASSTPRRRQSKLGAATSLGPPRPIGRCVVAIGQTCCSQTLCLPPTQVDSLLLLEQMHYWPRWFITPTPNPYPALLAALVRDEAPTP